MTASKWNPPARPTWVAEVNRVAREQEAVSGPMISFEIEALHAAASHNRHGLNNFGSDAYMEPLTRLVEAINGEANLHHAGALVTRDEIVNALECRLWVEDVFTRHPEAAEVDLGSIVFIGGPGRSGTSIAHEAFAAVSDTQYVTPWEFRAPWIHELPAEQREQAKEEAFRAVYHSWYGLLPELEIKHQMWREMPQECAWPLNQTFLTHYFSSSFLLVPTFQAWASTADMVPSYRQYKRFLQALQLTRGSGGGQLVLKTPQHTYAIEALFEVFPDAKFIWMHRDPIKTLASGMSFRRELAYSRADMIADIAAEGQAGLAALPDFLNWVIDYHKAMPRDRVYPLVYSKFLSDPVEALVGVRQAFGLPNDPGVRDAIDRYMKSRPQHVKGTHDYGPDVIGITDIEAAQQPLTPYFEYFGVKKEW